jgi:hypothetical protein
MSAIFSNKRQHLVMSVLRDNPLMLIQPRESSVIDHLSYAVYDSCLNVRFCSGSLYAYENVPFEMIMEALSAESIGSWFNENIRGEYEYSLIYASR